MATITYLPAPIKVERNHTDSKPDYLLWGGCTIALGILSFYAPKTFLATSVGIFGYQIYRFNQLAQTADASKHQQIHKWAINACLVMWSVGFVFGIKSLPSFASTLTNIRHLHLIHAVGHLVKGTMMIIVAGSLAQFNDSAKTLASHRRWVEMEDYVTNYPAVVKQNILSSYGKQIIFYISALLPQTRIAKLFSNVIFQCSQFQPEGDKLSKLQRYFKMIDKDLPLAIHQFQQLPVDAQISLGPQLRGAYRIELDFLFQGDQTNYDQLPDDVKAILLNETLKSSCSLSVSPPSLNFASAFERLPREQQSVLGQQLLYMIQSSMNQVIPSEYTQTMRLSALKAVFSSDVPSMALADILFKALTPPFNTEFGVFLKGLIENGKLEFSTISPHMQAVMPRTALRERAV